MQLYNNLSSKERAKLIDEAGKDRITVSFYKYHPIADAKNFRNELFSFWADLDVLGRIYVADEGINAQLSVPANRFLDLKSNLDSYVFMQGMRLNVAVEHDNKSFLKLKIKVRKKIVADGIDDPTFDASNMGVHLKAKEFNALIVEPETILVDMRNHYESEIGHFKGAITPDVDRFRDSLDIIEADLREHKDDKTLVMYCTGGIRCEKASAYFKHKGFQKVFQLEGGIIEYLRQVKSEGLENKFQGKNFVFDYRMAEKISDDVVSKCHLCGSTCDTIVNCNNNACNLLFIQCASCAEKYEKCCSDNCMRIAALPFEEQKALRKGYRAGVKFFRRLNPETKKAS